MSTKSQKNSPSKSKSSSKTSKSKSKNGVKTKDKKIVTEIIRKYLPDVVILAFGSRIDQTAKEFSDLDIALQDENKISNTSLFNIKNDLAESNLLFSVDICDFKSLDAAFKKIILKTCEQW